MLCDSAVPDQSHEDLNLVSQIFLSLVPTSYFPKPVCTEPSHFLINFTCHMGQHVILTYVVANICLDDLPSDNDSCK